MNCSIALQGRLINKGLRANQADKFKNVALRELINITFQSFCEDDFVQFRVGLPFSGLLQFITLYLFLLSRFPIHSHKFFISPNQTSNFHKSVASNLSRPYPSPLSSQTITSTHPEGLIVI